MGSDFLCVGLQREIRQQLAEKAKSGDLKVVNGSAASQASTKRKRRWDQTADQTPSNSTPKKVSSWDQADAGAEVSPLPTLNSDGCEVLLPLTDLSGPQDSRTHSCSHTVKQPLG